MEIEIFQRNSLVTANLNFISRLRASRKRTVAATRVKAFSKIFLITISAARNDGASNNRRITDKELYDVAPVTGFIKRQTTACTRNEKRAIPSSDQRWNGNGRRKYLAEDPQKKMDGSL